VPPLVELEIEGAVVLLFLLAGVVGAVLTGQLCDDVAKLKALKKINFILI